MNSKKELRIEVLAKRDALTIEERREKSEVIAEKIVQCKGFLQAEKILLYASFRSEVDTATIFQYAKAMNKEVYYPKVLGTEMEFYRIETESEFEKGCWGIQEPQVVEDRKFFPKYNEKICIIMPGSVFDKKGNRIGYGRGYYDKFLHRLEKTILCKIGIGFACQISDIKNFPIEEHDVCLDVLITEEVIYNF